MRSFEERKEEIFRRSEQRIVQRKKTVKRVVMTCVPLVLCLTVLSGVWILGGNNSTKASAPQMNESIKKDMHGTMADADAPAEAVMEEDAAVSLILVSQGKTFRHTDADTVEQFQQMLIRPETAGPQADPSGENQDSEATSQAETCTIIFAHEDDSREIYTLWGNELTGPDGTVYVLTDAQVQFLYGLMV